jgi:hypothetical protein
MPHKLSALLLLTQAPDTLAWSTLRGELAGPGIVAFHDAFHVQYLEKNSGANLKADPGLKQSLSRTI